MGTNWYVAFERTTNDIDGVDADRVYMARWMEELAALAGRLGVEPLDSFMSYDSADLAEYIEDESLLDELKDGAGDMRYFDPSEVLPSLRGLRAHLAVHREPFTQVSGQERAGDLVEELAHCERVLDKAAEQGVRFRFFVCE